MDCRGACLGGAGGFFAGDTVPIPRQALRINPNYSEAKKDFGPIAAQRAAGTMKGFNFWD
jgi:hypothetical protein